MSQQKKPDNLKTALILASVAVIFFLGVIIKRVWFS
ncbi:cytochrome oxidase small assembly protein [Janthinobacterium sp. 17J80-10]|nr:cytochrome oxidase small assembly protein [Janthinobacterium sp. 17J80-10]